MADSSQDLDSAYRETDFIVRVDVTAPLHIRVGQQHPRLDALLENHDERTWCYITADNPGSKCLAAHENEERYERLNESVNRSGYRYFSGEGVGAGDWPPEKSLLVIGVSLESSLRLGKEFGQRAIVFWRNCWTGMPPLLRQHVLKIDALRVHENHDSLSPMRVLLTYNFGLTPYFSVSYGDNLLI